MTGANERTPRASPGPKGGVARDKPRQESSSRPSTAVPRVDAALGRPHPLRVHRKMRCTLRFSRGSLKTPDSAGRARRGAHPQTVASRLKVHSILPWTFSALAFVNVLPGRGLRGSFARMTIACSFIFAFALPALAHGGEDHGEAPPPPTTSAETRSAAAMTTALEFVVRWPARAAAAGPLRLRVLLSAYASNAPLEGANVELRLSAAGHQDVVVIAPASKSPGVYEVDATLPVDAHYALVATIVAGELVDVVAIHDLDVGAPETAPSAHNHGDAATWPALVVLFALLAIGVVIMRRRRRRAGTPAVIAGALLLCTIATTAQAHGGEDHSEDNKTAKVSVQTGRVVLPKESQFLLGIRTVVIDKRALADRVTVPGVVTAPPERHAAVFAPQSGRVTPPPGGFPQLASPITRGQLLGVLQAVLSASERATFLSEEARARADILSATARVQAADNGATRVRSLVGVASQREMEAADVELASARAALGDAQARKNAFTTSAGVSRFELTSPLAGVLADIDVSPGEVLSQGDRAFLVIDPSALTVEAKVPEHELGRLRGSADALILVDAFPGKTFPAQLLAEAQIVEAATRTSKVIFSVDNTQGLLKLGMFAQVQIGAGAAASVVAVPDAAVLDIDGRRVVYLHTAPEEFEAREISLGRRDGDFLEVRAGLEGGERVVIIGAYNLRSAQAR